jgi:hypothetical protein
MSLNFVSTTVLSSTDGVSHNTETRLESSDAASTSRSGENYKPLYEQLRKNAQEEQEKYDEVTKAMRGTCTLDDEDVAHLQGIEDERSKRLQLQAVKEQEELESYRLAKLDYQESNKSKQDEQEEINTLVKLEKEKQKRIEQQQSNEKKSMLMQLKPKIVVTKKRRRNPSTISHGADNNYSNDTDNNKVTKKIAKNEQANTGSKESSTGISSKSPQNESSSKNEGSIGGLLSGYGSDSDSD